MPDESTYEVNETSAEVEPTEPGQPSAIVEFEEAQLSERELLRQERGQAVAEKSKASAWLLLLGFHPIVLVAIALALVVEGSPDLAGAFVALGAAVLAYRIYRADREIKKIEKQLEDPMDGS